MPKPVAEQVVVVVGASSGIGRACARRFAARGARVVVASRNERALRTLVERLDGERVLAVPTDITDAAAVRALAQAAEDRFGRIDTWVNVAGVGVFGTVEEVPAEEFERVMRTNFLGHVHGVHAALPALRRAGGGVVIGVSSMEGVRSVPWQAPYAASKFALRAMYDSLRVELAHKGDRIAVTTILPAAIDTPFFAHSRSHTGSLPKPPPPVYSAELVAEAVVSAAEHPRREVPVGGSAVAFYLGQRLFPAVTDALSASRALVRSVLDTGLPDNGTDNLDSPLDEPGRVGGGYDGRVVRHSPFTALASRFIRPGEVLTALMGRLHRR